MKAIRFHASIPRYVITKALGKLSKSAYYSFFSPTKVEDIAEPVVFPEWVKIKPIYSGICGSDINTILLKESTLLEPLCSFPSVLGHENVGIVTDIGEETNDIHIGDRVVLDPILSCKVRGIGKLCNYCQGGETIRCDNFDGQGTLSAGFDTGWCRETGGAFSHYYLAHWSQLHKVPNSASNENAVLVEPFTIGLHAVLRNYPKDSDTVIVLGTGVIGLMVINALRTLGSKAKIIAIDTNKNLAKLLLDKYGVDQFIQANETLYQRVSEEFNTRLYKPLLQKKHLIVGGGADIVYECVGLSSTIEDSLRFIKPRGKIILIGNPAKVNIDWSLVWSREIRIIGSFGSCIENIPVNNGFEEQHAFDFTLELMKTKKIDLSWMVTHRFRFPDEIKTALKYSMNKEKYDVIKGIFTFQE